MRTQRTKSHPPARAFALVASLVLVLALTVLIAAVQRLTAQEFAATKSATHEERALQLAEAGANAYLHQMSNGFVADAVPWMPPRNDRSGSQPAWPVDIPTFRRLAGAGDPAFPVRAYPAGAVRQGYVVGHVQSGSAITIVSYGFCEGAVRMVRSNIEEFNAFDWAAAYGLDPHTQANPGPGDDRGPAWNFGGTASVVGACGAEGEIKTNANATIYDGPVYLSGAGTTLNPGYNPTPLRSGPGLPTGHIGTGILSYPFVRRKPTPLAFKPVDAVANEYVKARFGVETTQGARYFAATANNQNNSGIHYLVRCIAGPNANKIRLGNRLTISNRNPVFNPPSSPDDATVGIVDRDTEELYGIRFYPGNYCFTQWRQPGRGALRTFFRTVADGEAGTRPDGTPLVVYLDTAYSVPDAHPVPSLSSERNVRIWIVDPAAGNASASDFSANMWIENQTFASRFRVMFASQGGMSIGGYGGDRFTANVLAYNTFVPTSGNFAGQTVSTGRVSINGAYLLGSLIAWQVSVGGNAVLEKQARFEPNPGDRFAYVVRDWSEVR